MGYSFIHFATTENLKEPPDHRQTFTSTSIIQMRTGRVSDPLPAQGMIRQEDSRWASVDLQVPHD